MAPTERRVCEEIQLARAHPGGPRFCAAVALRSSARARCGTRASAPSGALRPRRSAALLRHANFFTTQGLRSGVPREEELALPTPPKVALYQSHFVGQDTGRGVSTDV